MNHAYLNGNAKFGWMFVWSGCICQLLWAVNALIMRSGLTSDDLADLAPVFIYGALIIGGLTLTEPQPQDAQPLDQGAPQLADGATFGEKTCSLMVVGPLAPVQNVLLSFGHSVLIAHHGTVTEALQKLASFSAGEIPNILILPWWLPILKSSEVIRTLKADPTLASIHVLVWGNDMPAPEIRDLYDAGASCVIPMPLQRSLIPFLRNLSVKSRECE